MLPPLKRAFFILVLFVLAGATGVYVASGGGLIWERKNGHEDLANSTPLSV
jgi:hypothetical protein